MTHAYAAVPELKLLKAKDGKGKTATVTMGAYLKVLDDSDNDGWLKVRSFGKEGWVHRNDTAKKNQFLKIFFVDVGQGDGILIEVPGKRLIVDGGKTASRMRNFLTGSKYKWLVAKKDPIHIDAIVVTHFDEDHYGGLTAIIADKRFTIGTIYHNGIARFQRTKAKRPSEYNKPIGKTGYYFDAKGEKHTSLKSSFSTIADADKLLKNKAGLASYFAKFLTAVVNAKKQDRLKAMRRITSRDSQLPGFGEKSDLTVDVLGPAPLLSSGTVAYPYLEDDGHTINGHSVVLRLRYGTRSFLLGGDLNHLAQDYLLTVWHAQSFESDVAKACHHGASEFTLDFMKAVKPYATVFSSGDSESHFHPRADALGCAGRYSRGRRPLVFCTELARSQVKGKGTHYGMINCRCDGSTIAFAQMLEIRRAGDRWDVYGIK